MCRLSANLLASLNFLGILNRNSSLSTLQYNYKDYHGNNDSNDNQAGENALRNRFGSNKLLPQSCHILWNTGNNVDYQYDRDTVSDSLFRNALTHPHKYCRTGSERCNNHDHSQRIFAYQIASTIESNRHGNGLDQTKSDGYVTCDGSNFLSSFFSVTLHLFQLRNGNGQKLHNNGSRDVRCDIQCKYRHIQE